MRAILGLLATSILLTVTSVASAEPPENGDPGTGALFAKMNGILVPMPVVAMEVSLSISGPIVRGRVVQTLEPTSFPFLRAPAWWSKNGRTFSVRASRTSRRMRRSSSTSTRSMRRNGARGWFSTTFPTTITARYAPLVALHATVDAGLELAAITSSSHRIRTIGHGSSFDVKAGDGPVPADRDFVLRWQPKGGLRSMAGGLVEERADGRYGLAMLVPPRLSQDGVGTFPTQTVFVVDVSGSMSGPSLDQAKAALDVALGRLCPGDTFTLIKFDSENEAYAERFIEADPDPVPDLYEERTLVVTARFDPPWPLPELRGWGRAPGGPVTMDVDFALAKRYCLVTAYTIFVVVADESFAAEGASGNCVLAGYRDRWASFLAELRPVDDVVVETPKGRVDCRVVSIEVVRFDGGAYPTRKGARGSVPSGGHAQRLWASAPSSDPVRGRTTPRCCNRSGTVRRRRSP